MRIMQYLTRLRLRPTRHVRASCGAASSRQLTVDSRQLGSQDRSFGATFVRSAWSMRAISEASRWNGS